MADTVTSQTLIDGERTVIMKFTNISDGTGESAVLKVDVSALTASSFTILRGFNASSSSLLCLLEAS